MLGVSIRDATTSRIRSRMSFRGDGSPSGRREQPVDEKNFDSVTVYIRCLSGRKESKKGPFHVQVPDSRAGSRPGLCGL